MFERDNEYPDYLKEAAQTIDTLRQERHRQLPRRERLVQAFMQRIGRPRVILLVSAFIIVWVVTNVVLWSRGPGFDTRSFSLLATIMQAMNLLVAVAILTAENTQQTLHEERTRLLLQLSMVHDQKITKALNDIEDLRRVNPEVETADGPEDELHRPTDLRAAADLIQQTSERSADEEEPEFS